MRRRTVLTALGATTLGGCLSQAEQLANQKTKTMTQQTPPECDSDLALLTTDLDQKYTIKKGTTEKFSLEIEPASVNLGQDISIHLKIYPPSRRGLDLVIITQFKRKIMVSGITFFRPKVMCF